MESTASTASSAAVGIESVGPERSLARNALGLREVLFCIVTGAAPIAAMQFNVPWAVGGAGYAAPRRSCWPRSC